VESIGASRLIAPAATKSIDLFIPLPDGGTHKKLQSQPIFGTLMMSERASVGSAGILPVKEATSWKLVLRWHPSSS
jgi:hypothetical protein